MTRFSQGNETVVICRLLVTVIVLSIVSGCGKQNSGRVPVQGTVTYRGEPVALGSIALRPMRETSGPAAGTDIIDGKFEIPRHAGPGTGSYAARITIVRPSEYAAADSFARQGGKVQTLEVLVDITSVPKEYDFQLPFSVRKR